LFVNENRVTVLDDFELAEVKTKALCEVLGRLGVDSGLLIDSTENDKLKLSVRNLQKHQFLSPQGLNVYDLLRHNQLVISKRAVLEIQSRLDRPSRAGKVSK
jgi:large subunit ribosomal protein L4